MDCPNLRAWETIRPATDRFAAIAAIYRSQAIALPEEVEDGWEQLLRICDYATDIISNW